MIASDMTITSTSIVSHVGMRFARWVIAWASAAHVMCRMASSGYERVHMSWQAKFLGGLGSKGVDRVGDEHANA